MDFKLARWAFDCEMPLCQSDRLDVSVGEIAEPADHCWTEYRCIEPETRD